MASVISYTKDRIDQMFSGVTQALSGKSNTGHGHTIGQITDLQEALNGKTGTGHTHVITSVLGLQVALDNKAPKVHDHLTINITDAVSQVSTTYPDRALKTNADGTLTIQDNSIINPTSAVNKRYVDTQVVNAAPWVGTQAQYNNINPKNPNRTYIILGA